MQDIYKTFEFARIGESLLEYSKTERSREWIRSLTMFENKEEMKEALEDLREMTSILVRFGPVPIATSASALKIIDMAKKTGLLTPRDLSLIADDVETSIQISRFLDKIDVSSYPRVKGKAAGFYDLTSLAKEIHRVITPSLTVADDASPELRDIRRGIKKAEAELNKLIMTLAATYASVMTDANSTIRDGHYVLPVKTSLKARVPGIVYDMSDTGNTTFIEPMEIVQINNNITQLKVEENEEIRKILRQMTSLVLLQEGEITENNRIIAELDFLLAKSLYAAEINGVIADFSDSQVIDLVSARHPLIHKEKVVSNSYHLDEEKRIVIISGPNAGGKTVSLKVIGLLVMMNQAGLAVPAEHATLGYFRNIFIDIGDNQSLSDNLSTFSAHMSHLGEIIQQVKGRDLVLIDELGTGTDPKEGEALAYAITRFLEGKHPLCVISSHFGALKEYAFLSPDIENSSMIFDEENLLPTYRFHLGSPGRSYALDVATRYGISEDIVKEAKAFLDSESDGKTSDLLDILQKKILDANKTLQAIEEEKRLIDNQKRELDRKEEQLEAKKEKLYDSVEMEKERLIRKAKLEIDTIVANLSKEDVSANRAVKAKRELDELGRHEEVVEFNEKISEGDYVSVPALNLNGRVSKIKGQKAHINTTDGLSFDVELNKLHVIDAPKETKKVQPSYDARINANVGLELNIIGLRYDEGKNALVQYIDNCRLKNFTTVRIIHGFGSGTLRQMTHDYLKKQKDLTFRLGDGSEGGSGATVVTFKHDRKN